MTHIFKGCLRKGNDFTVYFVWRSFLCFFRNCFICDRSFKPSVFPTSGRTVQRYFRFRHSLKCFDHFRLFFCFRNSHSFTDRHILIRCFLLQSFLQECICDLFHAGICYRYHRSVSPWNREPLLIETFRIFRCFFLSAHIDKAFQWDIASQLAGAVSIFFRNVDHFCLCAKTRFQRFCFLDIIPIREPENDIVTDLQTFFFVPEFIIKSC